MSVVAAGELHHEVSSGGSPGQADRGHGGLGPGGNEANQLRGRHPLAHQFREHHLRFSGGAETEPPSGGLLHCRHHLGVCMPEQGGSPGTHEVHPLDTFDISDVGTAR